MVKRLLSIDFDIIMAPCIKLYNDMSNGGENPTVTWNAIEFERGVDEKFLMYDANTYKTLVKLVKMVMDFNIFCNVVPVTAHHEIIDNLKKSLDYDETTYDLINIDYHHDIMYRPQDRNTIKNFDKYNCSNWVGYLMLKDKIDKYTWVKAGNSLAYDHRLDGKTPLDFDVQSLRYIEDGIKYPNSLRPDQISPINISTIYLCLSPQWVPYKYHHLYDLIVELFSKEGEIQ